ncbi:MAG TPA: gliding motility lipoprotein GldH [Chitinophagaceae bacterium]
MKLTGFCCIVLLLIATGCSTNAVYEKMAFFPAQEWISGRPESFKFEITDTASSYRLYLVLRHTDAYRWKNIWINLGFRTPDSSYTVRREFTLADNEKWFGTTMDDIVEQRIPFTPNNAPVQLKKGSYTFTLQHVMREDPLQHVLNAGVRVEKVK